MKLDKGNATKQHPITILQAYRVASEVAKKASDVDEEIAAFGQVVELGLRQKNLSDEEALKSNMIMYWAYNNLGEAYVKKQNPKASNKFYENSLHFARDNVEKISVLNRIAKNYFYLGDDEKWLDTRQKIIEHLKNEDKRRAYTALAEELQNNKQAAEIYEKALQFVNDEELSILAKCQNTLFICDRLRRLYRNLGDKENYERISNLADKTAALAVKTLEERIDNEDDRSKKVDNFIKMIEIENKFHKPDTIRKACIYRRLGDLLKKGEVVKVDGKSYSKEIIKKLLK